MHLILDNKAVESTLPKAQVLPAALQKGKIDIELLHRRLAHMGLTNVRKTLRITKGFDIDDVIDEVNSLKGGITERLCEPCELAKPLRSTRKHRDRPVEALDEVDVDIIKITPAAYNGHMYAAIFTDAATRARWGWSFTEKGSAYDSFCSFISLMNTQYNKIVKCFRLDGGPEFGINVLIEICKKLGVRYEPTTPHNAEQNGGSERANRIITERMRSAIIDANIPKELWPEVFTAVIHITNRVATSTLDMTPYEAFMNQVDPGKDHKPSIEHIRVLGCKSYVHIAKERRTTSDKMEARAEEGILVGFEGTHIWRIWVPGRGRKLVRSSNVRFEESAINDSKVKLKEIDVVENEAIQEAPHSSGRGEAQDESTATVAPEFTPEFVDSEVMESPPISPVIPISQDTTLDSQVH